MPAQIPREPIRTLSAQAIAHANIALAKYWGKADERHNLPAVSSISITLDRLTTETSVTFDPKLAEDVAMIDGLEQDGRPLERISGFLDHVRRLAGTPHRARVESRNSFPTASGLASSASGFAALALAATRAAGLACTSEELSALARRASASAARSIFGGYVALRTGAESAEPLLAREGWPLRMVVAVTSTEPKTLSSTEAMLRTARTSPYYAAWIASAADLFAEVETAIRARDLEHLGDAMEASTLAMHASMLAARPSILYFSETTLRAIACVKALRASGVSAYFTMDAGPHVKVLTTIESAPRVCAELRAIPGVKDVLICSPGPAAHAKESASIPT